jgi:hypothetical protein
MYSLDCSYYKAEFETIDELIEAATAHPCSSHAFFITFQKYIQNIAKKR